MIRRNFNNQTHLHLPRVGMVSCAEQDLVRWIPANRSLVPYVGDYGEVIVDRLTWRAVN